MFLLTETEATWTDSRNIRVEPQLPAGAWAIAYRPPNGDPYLKRIAGYSTEHGRIYGNPEWIANHVADAFQKMPDRNLGVLLSGHKGLGKSLTIKLIVARLIENTPVVLIDQFTPMLPDVLSKLTDAVIVIDEFEKMFRSLKNDHSEGMSPQETLLSVMDGTKSSGHRLFLMSINSLLGIDENLICRPGRVRYHFRFGNISEKAVEDYCKDNLKESRWPEIPDVIEAVRTASVQSLDIVGALVSEMNLYDTPVAEIASYLNIGETRVVAEITVTILVDGKPLILQDEISCTDNGIFIDWVARGTVFLKLRPGQLSFQGRQIPREQFNAERFDNLYPTKEETLGDPCWDRFKDSDGDIYLPLSDPKFRADHEVRVSSVFVRRRPQFGAF